MPKKNKPTPWALRPGDLPPADVIAREPRLAGLEDNALFFLSRRRSCQREESFGKWEHFVGILLIYLICYGGLFGIYIVLIIALVRTLYRRMNVPSHVLNKMAKNFGVEPGHLIELRQSPMTPEDFVNAAWGLQYERNQNFETGLNIGLIMLGIPFSLFLGTSVFYEMIAGPVLGILLGFALWRRILYNDRILKSLDDIHRQLTKLDRREGASDRPLKFFVQPFVLFLMIFVSMLCFELLGRGTHGAPFRTAGQISSVFCALIGAITGWIHFDDMRSRYAQYYDQCLDRAVSIIEGIGEYDHAEKK